MLVLLGGITKARKTTYDIWKKLHSGKFDTINNISCKHNLRDFGLNYHFILLGVWPEFDNFEAGNSKEVFPSCLGSFRCRKKGHHVHIHRGLADTRARWW